LALTLIALLVVLAGAFSAGARARPECFGKPATEVGTGHVDKIVAKPNAVVFAGKGNDTITVAPSDRTKHLICGGPGKDVIKAGPRKDIVIGASGNDKLKGGNGDDLIVGDNAEPGGAVDGSTGKDTIAGSGGSDFMVGDNYAIRGDATRASPDNLLGSSGNDVVIGDSASKKGNATGGVDDRMGGASGNDTAIGDSHAPLGTASGGGNDDVNGGPGNDLQVGDSYTETGRAIGSGDDSVHASDGGDNDAKCKPRTCDDVLYGDDYAKSCGLKWVSCRSISPDGGADLLNGDQGDDFMNGGPPDAPGLGRKGDRCAGGPGRDTATRCEDQDAEVVRPFP
jgi:Ca2+-binding RTX toxin-like protein